MKKIILIGLIFLSISAIAQTYPPYYQNLGSPSTAVEDKGGLFVRGTFVPPQFVDTTAANAAPHTQFYAGSEINTTSDNLYWYRSNDLTQWIKMGSSSGGSGTDSLSFHSITQSPDSTSAKFNRPNGTGTVLKFIYDTTGGGSSGITQQQLDDTASAIRSSYYLKSQIDVFLAAKQNTINVTTAGSGAATWDGTNLNIPTPSIPAQFNPIAGTGISLSGTYPNITFNASGSAGITNVDSTNIATTAAQTVFTFPYTLTNYTSKQIIRNGVAIDPSYYTVNTGNITFTGFTCDSGDKIRFIGIK